MGAILSTRYLTISEAANALGTTRDKMLLLLLGNNGGHGNPIGLSLQWWTKERLETLMSCKQGWELYGKAFMRFHDFFPEKSRASSRKISQHPDRKSLGYILGFALRNSHKTIEAAAHALQTDRKSLGFLISNEFDKAECGKTLPWWAKPLPKRDGQSRIEIMAQGVAAIAIDPIIGDRRKDQAACALRKLTTHIILMAKSSSLSLKDRETLPSQEKITHILSAPWRMAAGEVLTRLVDLPPGIDRELVACATPEILNGTHPVLENYTNAAREIVKACNLHITNRAELSGKTALVFLPQRGGDEERAYLAHRLQRIIRPVRQLSGPL